MSSIRWSEYGSFSVVPEWILDAEISDRAVRLFAVLGRYADSKKLQAMPSRKTLADRLRCSRSTLDGALGELRVIGALSWSERIREDGGRGANEYVLHPTPLPMDRVPPTDEPAEAVTDAPGVPLTDGSVGNELEPVELEPVELDFTAPPRAMLVDSRNLGFDALADACGVDPKGNRSGQVAVALNGSAKTGIGIRELVWREVVARGDSDLLDLFASQPERFEVILAARIQMRAGEYKRAMRGAMLTPTALAKWWTDLETIPLPDISSPGRFGRGLTTKQTAELFGIRDELP